jgi:crotonobetainyl-CoA:carnitine CoA-transferase CaiB-like acyl-CoA transferase
MGELLADLRVLDLTDGYGAFASRLFAELGAEVVRLEPADGGEGRRRAPFASDGTSLHHLFRNSGKSVLSIDPDTAGDRDEVGSLLAGADIVFMSNLTPASWGTPQSIVDVHPHLVCVSITPLGLDGPCADWQVTELVGQAMGGVVYRSGVPDLPPVAAPGSMCEDVGAVTAAMAALLALRQVDDGAGGQVIDLSTVLALAACTDMSLALWSLLQFDQVRSGAGLYPLFECTDGLARIVLPMTPADWRSLIVWLGSPAEWTGGGWDLPMLGADERAEIIDRLPQRFASCTRAEIEAQGDAAGVRITSVLTPSEILDNEHTRARETFTPVTVGSVGTGLLMAGMFGVDGHRAAVGAGPVGLDAAPPWEPRPSAAASSTSPPLPLAGIRVIEIGSGVAAPEATRILAEWGADVIKVESRRHPDFQRMVMGGEMNPAFATPNRCKRVFGAELGTAEGRDLVLDLVREADVLIENNATGVLDRLGLGWDRLREVNPRLVLVDTQLYGDRGPWATRKGYGPSARAVGGLTWLWAHGPDSPRGVQSIHPDHLGGRLCAFGALAALHGRDATDVGVRVDVAQFEAVSGLLGDLLLQESITRGSVVPTGNRDEFHSPWNLYRCLDDADGAETWLALTIRDDDDWRSLRSVAGDSLAAPAIWDSADGRLADADAVDRSVADWLRTRDGEQLEIDLQSQGVPAGRALHPRLQASHPQFVARGYPVALDQPGSGSLVVEGPVFAGRRLGAPRCGPAPRLGEDTETICRDLLGLDAAAIAALESIGAIEGSGS